MMQACLFSLCCLWLKQRVQLSASFYDKSRTPPLSRSLFLFLKKSHDDESTTSLRVRYLSTHVRTHACITKWLMQPTPRPAGDFPWCSGAAQCVTDLRARAGGGVRYGSRFGWQMRCVLACCWKCDSPRPTWHTHTKKIEMISYLTLCSFCVSSGRVTYRPWFHACVTQLLDGHIATCLKYRSVPELLCGH